LKLKIKDDYKYLNLENYHYDDGGTKNDTSDDFLVENKTGDAYKVFDKDGKYYGIAEKMKPVAEENTDVIDPTVIDTSAWKPNGGVVSTMQRLDKQPIKLFKYENISDLEEKLQIINEIKNLLLGTRAEIKINSNGMFDINFN